MTQLREIGSIGKVKNLVIGILALLLGVLTACSNREGKRLQRHDLFEIQLGNLPNELDWFYRDNLRMAGTAEIQTRDGLVFISGGGAAKVMVFNSYGDLLTYVYNPSRNPKPVFPDDGTEKQSTSTWPFLSPRTIATFKDGFLVDDGVEQRRRVQDNDSGIIYDRVVLIFDDTGKYLNYLGREGYGGSPFPYIVSVSVREDGGIVVLSHISKTWISFWFDKTGHPIATASVREDQLPGLEEGGIAAVYSIHPDPVKWVLHIRLDLYPDTKHGENPSPRLYTLDLNTLTYGDPIILQYLHTGDDDLPSIPPDYLGTSRNGIHFMLTPVGGFNYRLVLIDGEGRVVQNRRLSVPESTTLYRRFNLQNDGMITGIFFNNSEATVAWWQADKLLGK